VIKYNRIFTGNGCATFQNSENLDIEFSIELIDDGFIHVDKNHVKRLRNIVINGGKYDGVILIKRLLDDEVETIVSRISNKINNDTELRLMVAYCTANNIKMR